MRKILTAVLALVMLTAFAGCQQTPGQTNTQQTVTIPAVTVDLQAPENRVEVPQDVPSHVFDEEGNQLSDSQWLLNSKFAKSYIQKLGVGTYTYRYESASQTGTITLTVTDSQAPDYIFTGAVPETVTYLDSLTLPELVKEQDSYQSNYRVSYSLTVGEETVFVDDFQTPALTEGSYTWTATVNKDGKPYEFSQSFRVQSFEEYLSGMENELLLNRQNKTCIPVQDCVYPVDTNANTLDYFYQVNPQVVATAMTAGKTEAHIVVTTETPIGGSNGSLWLSNDWHGYVMGISGTSPFVDDRSAPSWPTRYIGSMKIADGKYVYTMVAYLDETVFTEAQPLTLQFNYAKCLADVTVSFE